MSEEEPDNGPDQAWVSKRQKKTEKNVSKIEQNGAKQNNKTSVDYKAKSIELMTKFGNIQCGH